jgi:imidazolonepropionase
MVNLLIENIKGLVLVSRESNETGPEESMDHLPIENDAYLFIENGKIADFGTMAQKSIDRAHRTIDATGKYVLPCFVDSHTHLVYAGSREHEFVDRIKGLSYAEIAAKGGGILNSARLLQQTSEEALYQSALQRLHEVMGTATGAIEIKSGYGLTVEDELKILRVARRLRDYAPIPVKTTFLGAHAVPVGYTREAYIDLVVNDMIPRVADQGLADYCDVFCEDGFFSPEEASSIIEQGLKYGLKPKIHANQLNNSGGVQVGVKHGAVSVDHLETIGPEEIDCLKNSNTIPTLLPAASFFLDMHYAPARKMLEAALPVALATDYNPGSSPTGNMPLVVSLACIKMKMTPGEAIVAATMNGARAIECQHQLGSIARGKLANIFISRPMTSIEFLPYAFGSNMVETVSLNGQIL